MKRFSTLVFLLLLGTTLIVAGCSKKGAATGSSKHKKSSCGCPHF